MRVQPLTESKIAQAYPLIRFLQPRLSLDEWMQFTAEYLVVDQASDRGILTVEDDRGLILAMLAYSVDLDLFHGRILAAKDVIAVTSLDKSRKAAISVLYAALEELAKEKRCIAVHTRVSADKPEAKKDSLHGSLLSSGHAVDHFVFCKIL